MSRRPSRAPSGGKAPASQTELKPVKPDQTQQAAYDQIKPLVSGFQGFPKQLAADAKAGILEAGWCVADEVQCRRLLPRRFFFCSPSAHAKSAEWSAVRNSKRRYSSIQSSAMEGWLSG